MNKQPPHLTIESLNRSVLHDAAMVSNNFAITYERRQEELSLLKAYYEGYCDARGWKYDEIAHSLLSH